MINSDFDRVIRGENNNNNNGKSKWKIIVVIIIFIIIAIVGILGYSYYSDYKTVMPKMKFFEYASKTNIQSLTDTTMLKQILDKMDENSYTIKNEIVVQLNEEERNAQNLNIDLDVFNDKEKQIDMLDISVGNDNKELIKFTGIKDTKNIGIKSEDIVVKFIGSKISNVASLANRIYGMQIGQDVENRLNNEKQKIEIPQKDNFSSYKQIVVSKLSDEQFRIEKNVKLTTNNSSIDTTLYELNLNKDKILNIITELKDNLINDDILLNSLVSEQTEETEDIGINFEDIFNLILGYKIDANTDKIKEEIENIFTKIFESLNKIEDLSLKFDIYVSNSRVVKQVITLENLLEINLDYVVNSENENGAKLTVLLNEQEVESKNGFSINLNRINNNVITKLELELSIIEDMQINNKYKFETTLEGNQSSNVINNNSTITISNTEEQYVTKINSKLEYVVNEKIEKLNSDNCLFLDELDDQTLNDVKDAITEKAIQVFFNKIEEFFEIEEEENNEVENIVNLDREEEEEKEIAKNKLIEAIKSEMLKAREEDRDYVIADLQQLKVQGSTVSVMVSENLAIVAIDGYTFYISPDFELTEE